MKEGSWLAPHYMFWFPDASPGDFHSCAFQAGRSFKQQGLSHWIVLLQRKNMKLPQMSLQKMLQSSTVYSASGEATHVGSQAPLYEAVAMKHLGSQWDFPEVTFW